MVTREEGRSWWPWLLGVLVLALLVIALTRIVGGSAPDVKVEEAVPAPG